MTLDIERAIERFRAGMMIILVDDEHRENEGDLVIAAEFADAAAINFMTTHGRGLLCVPMEMQRARELGLTPMCLDNTALHEPQFTVSVDARRGIGTGISAQDRAETIRLLLDEKTAPCDLARPGHVFPLIARDGGVLRRAGHTEATVDLARLAGLRPAAVLCEILAEDGSMARTPQLEAFAEKHGLGIVQIADLVAYRERTERLVERIDSTPLPTRHGTFTMIRYVHAIDEGESIALVKGDVAGKKDVLARVHSECHDGEVFGSLRCDCGDQLHRAMERIEREGVGVVVYLCRSRRSANRDNGACPDPLQNRGSNTTDAGPRLGLETNRRYHGLGAQILRDLGLISIRLLGNDADKGVGFSEYGITISEQIPLEAGSRGSAQSQRLAQKETLGHQLSSV
jgi:3,4-dihydroxy 2-butanone 4-phosphate synthase/GTP cyclohydrolase II